MSTDLSRRAAMRALTCCAGLPVVVAMGGGIAQAQEAAAPAAAAQQSHPGSAAVDTDHDGQTVMKSSIPTSAGQPATPVAEDPAAGPTVLARVCRQGHANPPTRAQCAACAAGLLPDAVQVPRPRLGRVRVSTGELLDLDALEGGLHVRRPDPHREGAAGRRRSAPSRA